jgi:hypothetical protein
VTFKGDGLELVGDLRLPDGTPPEGGRPALADLRDATSFLATQPQVNAARLGACGISASAAVTRCASPLSTHGYNDPRAMQRGMGADGYRAQLLRFAEAAQKQFAGGTVAKAHPAQQG